MDEFICDHAHMCKQNPTSYSKRDYCTGLHPHPYNHEEGNGFNCPHANSEWVKDISMYVPNPKLRRK